MRFREVEKNIENEKINKEDWYLWLLHLLQFHYLL